MKIELPEEMDKYGMQLMGICETKKTDNEEANKKTQTIFSGVAQNKIVKEKVGIVVAEGLYENCRTIDNKGITAGVTFVQIYEHTKSTKKGNKKGI